MSDKVCFGPANPHPLSQIKTELVWDGDYDEYRNRRVDDIVRCSMPKTETINESKGQIELFAKTTASGDERSISRFGQETTKY